MYKPNPECYGAMFAIPACVADTYLADATGDSLKTLLCIFRNPSGVISIDALSKALCLTADQVVAALNFWVSKGVLHFTDEQGNVKYVPKQSAKKPVQRPAQAMPMHPVKAVDATPIPKPSMEQIAARLSEDESVRSLFTEAQQILGRTFGLDVQTTLLELFDTYGLHKEIILTLLQYLTDNGKNATSNIAKYGKIWAEKEIETLEQANEYIVSDTQATHLFHKFAAATGISNPRPTAKQAEYLLSWENMGFSLEMLIKAYEETAERTGKPSFAYMDKILQNWHAQGLKAPDDVDANQKASAAARKKAQSAGSSFDLDEALKKATLSAKKLAKAKNTE